MRPVTLKDVAEAANVSTAAVSKVLHGAGTSVRVSTERAAEIRAIAERLNYRVNAVARNLRTSRSNTVGIFFENMQGLADGPLYTTNLLDGISSVLFRNGFRLTLLAEIDQSNVIGSLGDGQLDGVIWCKLARNEAMVELIRKIPIPIVAFNAAAAESGTDTVYVNCDNEGGFELAVAHLWDLGHRKIAFLNEVEESDTPDCVARRQSYEAALHRRGGVPIEVEWQWELWGIADHLMCLGCTAVIGWSESVAGRLLLRLRESDIDVPQKLSVVGFDSTQYCETTTPRMTAIKQPIREMAAYAAQSLLDLIAGNKPSIVSSVFPCSIDIRGSTAEPHE